MTTNGFRLYLRLDDVVTHRDYRQWGEGRVVEEMTSTVPGGTCLVRVQFQDGRLRTFNNDLDHEQCCYFFGVRKIRSFDPFEGTETRQPAEHLRAPTPVEDLRGEPVARAPRARRPSKPREIAPPRKRLPAK